MKYYLRWDRFTDGPVINGRAKRVIDMTFYGPKESVADVLNSATEWMERHLGERISVVGLADDTVLDENHHIVIKDNNKINFLSNG